MPRITTPILSRLWQGLATLALITTFSACASVPEQYRTSRLALQRGTFSGFKYTLDGSEAEKVNSFWGTYSSSFLETLSSQPEALAEAKLSQPYQYASLGLTLVGGIYAFSELLASGDSDNSTFGGINETESHLNRAIAVMLVTVIGSSLLTIPARTHMYNAVGMFNDGLGASGPDAGGRGLGPKLLYALPSTVRLDPATGRVDLGWNLRTFGGR